MLSVIKSQLKMLTNLKLYVKPHICKKKKQIIGLVKTHSIKNQNHFLKQNLPSFHP